MTTLKPCPFCGGEATISDGGYSGEKFLARCRELSCPAASGFIRKTHDEAIAAWNRRADVAPVMRGEWVKKSSEEAETLALCSKCSYPISWWHKTNYCPNCGADMQRESEVKA